MGLVQVLYRAGAGKGQGCIHHAGVADVGVAQGVGGLGVPGQARAGHHHQRAPAGGPHRVLPHLQLAVRTGDLGADLAGGHLLGLAVHKVGGGVAFGQRHFVERKALAGGHRVRPGHVLVEADGDHRVGADAHAHHVHLAGDGEVHFIEAVGAAPREVRVAQQHAAAVARHVLAKGPGVGAQGRVEQAHIAQRLGGIGQVHVSGGCLRRLGGGRLGAQHAVGQRGNAGLHGHHLGHAAVLGHGHGLHPGLAPAGLGQRGGVVGQKPVVARHIAARQGLRFGTGLGPGALQHGVVHVGGHEQVDLRVGDVAAAQQPDGLRAEGAAALAACCDELVGRHADVVLRVGVRHAVSQRFWVVCGDVRNAVGGALDGHAAVCACSAWLAGAARQEEGGAGRCQGGQGH